MNDDLTGQRLGTALRNHVPPTPSSGLDLADVKGRARSIRQRRTFAGAAGAALTVALIAGLGPMALTALQGEDRTMPSPATQAPSPTPRGDVELTAEAPRGDDAVGWSDLEELGELFGDAMPEAPYGLRTVAQLGESWFLPHSREGRSFLLMRDGDGTVTEWKTTQGVALGDDVIAFVNREDDQLTVVAEDGTTRVIGAVPSAATVVDVTGDGCLDGGACTTLLSFHGNRGPLVVDTDGNVTPADPTAVAVTAAHDGLVALLDPSEPDPDNEVDVPSCSRVLDSGEELWKSCDLMVTSFSPDGRWGLVLDAYQSGWGPSRVGVVDARTGEFFFWMDPGDDAGVGSYAWEGDDVVLSTWSWTEQRWDLLRVSLTGEVERAADGRDGTESDFPYAAPLLP